MPVISVIPLDIRDRSAIDRQTNSEFGSDIRTSLHDQMSAAVTGARLALIACQAYASASKNEEDSVAVILMSRIHGSPLSQDESLPAVISDAEIEI